MTKNRGPFVILPIPLIKNVRVNYYLIIDTTISNYFNCKNIENSFKFLYGYTITLLPGLVTYSPLMYKYVKIRSIHKGESFGLR